MKAAAWRTVALTLILLGIGFVCYQTTLPDQDSYGIHFTIPGQEPGLVRVTSVDANSQAAQAGIRAGDVINYGNTALERARVVYATPGSRVSVRINDSRTATLTARSAQHETIPLGTLIIRLAFLLVAAMLAWRRPEDPATRPLVVFLWCFGLAIAMSNGVLPSPLLSLFVLQLGSALLFLAGTGAAALFVAIFPSGTAQPIPGVLAKICITLVVFASIGLFVAEWLPRSANGVSILNFGLRATFVAIGVLVIATLVAAYVQGEPSERARRRWLFFILGAALGATLLDVSVQLIFGLQRWIDILAQIPLAFLPIGLAYVILRHRVIDVGFVLNRAVVYTIVSAIVVAIFVVVETLLSKYVEATSHIGSIAVQMFVALILGFSVRAIHTRVDRFVDSLLFRERHLAEAAIRFFAHDASYITDRDVLVTRCVKTVERYAGARGAGVWAAQSAVYHPSAATFDRPADVDENDPAVVAMRARRVVVELRDTESSLPGALAFPMTVRGELIGMLVCGPKKDDETYDPDERDTLAYLASSVGHALDAIEVRDLRRRLEELTATRGGQPAF